MVAADTIEDIERLLPRVVKLWRFLRDFCLMLCMAVVGKSCFMNQRLAEQNWSV